MKKPFNLRTRLKYYLVTYSFGYFFSLFYITGVINWKYVIPIKLFAIIITLIIGNALYYAMEERMLIFEGTFRCIKYVLLVLVLIIVFSTLQDILLADYSIDIRPFIGM